MKNTNHKNKIIIFGSQLKSKSGFTLIETMVAIFIISLVVTSLLSIVANNIFAVRYSKNDIIATYLMQEAVDYIRNDRDSKVFHDTNPLGTGVAWDDFLGDYALCSGDYGCVIDIKNNGSVSACSGSPSWGNVGCPYFYYDKDASDHYFYYYDSSATPVGSLTQFKRKIQLKQNPNEPNEIFVKVTAEWKNGNLVRSKNIQTSLLRWQ